MTSVSVPHFPSGLWAKRVLDIALTIAGLIPAIPVMAVVAVAIKLDSRGPVLYRQTRLGRRERPFTILKFRSMRVDADEGPKSTATNDPRITRVGKLLRSTSVDELPQLLNVLLGDMSLIGPRPYVGFELEDWSETERAARATLRPGLSGLAQVSGRSDLKPAEIRELDVRYVCQWTFMKDLALIWRTATSVLLRKGVN
jgi:lipopolysaccharide/colanic/teichoic acid biosynthesis glycosyltransferase